MSIWSRICLPCLLVVAFHELHTGCSMCEPQWIRDLVEESKPIPTEATVLTLLHAEDTVISADCSSETRLRLAYKILTRAGRERARWSCSVGPFVKVEDLDCWVVKPDGKLRSLDDSEVSKRGMLGSAALYNDRLELVAEPSHVEPGDIVAYEVVVREEDLPSLYQVFAFQEQEPVSTARFSVSVPDGWEVVYGEQGIDSVDFDRRGNAYVWTASDLPYRPDEPLAPPWSYLLRRLLVSCFAPGGGPGTGFSDWKAVAAWYADLTSGPATPDQAITDEAARIAGGFSALEDKARAIAEFCQSEIRYVSVAIGKQYWVPRQASATLATRYGDCKDKAVLMVALLRALGIEAAPVLCNAGSRVDDRVPCPGQFNHVVVALRLGSGVDRLLEAAGAQGWIFFDPTDETVPLGHLPWHLQGATVVLAAATEPVLIELPYPEPEDFRTVYRATLELSEDGSFSGTAAVTYFAGLVPYARLLHRTQPQKDRLEAMLRLVTASAPATEITDFSMGDTADSAWAAFALSCPHYLQQTGGMMLLRPDVFTAPAPSLLTAKQRVFPIWFGSPLEVSSIVDWVLPVGWTCEADTTAAEYQCDGASISSKTRVAGNTLRVVATYRRTGFGVEPEAYDAARTFSRNRSRVSGQTVALRRG
ncbi:MAG: DUF3857 and transglutaminase domain-containing protein [bacterium]